LAEFGETLNYQISKKFVQWERTDRRTDRDMKKLTAALRNFANAPEIDTLQKNRKSCNVITARVIADSSLMTLSWFSHYKICLLHEITIRLFTTVL